MPCLLQSQNGLLLQLGKHSPQTRPCTDDLWHCHHHRCLNDAYRSRRWHSKLQQFLSSTQRTPRTPSAPHQHFHPLIPTGSAPLIITTIRNTWEKIHPAVGAEKEIPLLSTMWLMPKIRMQNLHYQAQNDLKGPCTGEWDPCYYLSMAPNWWVDFIWVICSG